MNVLKYLNDDKVNNYILRHLGIADLGESGENEDLAERLNHLSQNIDRYRLAHMVDMKEQIEK